jgi:hypothetical protein
MATRETLIDPGRTRLSPADITAGGQRCVAALARRTGRNGCSGGQLDAALAPTGGQDGTAGASAHAETEAVSLRATAVVRLESTLGHEWAPGLSASPAHGDARQWLAYRKRGMRNSRRVASRPSYVRGHACPRSNRRARLYRVSTFPQATFPPTPRHPQDVHAVSLVLPLGCGQRLVHSWGQGYCRPFQTFSLLRECARAAGIRLCTPCGFDVDFEQCPRRGHGDAGMWTTAESGTPGGHRCG